MELFHVYPDQRSTTQPVEKMAFMLSRGLRKEGDKRDHPFRRVKFVPSHECQALQISDILIGAVAYRLNRHYDRPDANSDKKRLCDYIFEKTGFNRFVIVGPTKFHEKAFGSYQLWVRKHRR